MLAVSSIDSAAGSSWPVVGLALGTVVCLMSRVTSLGELALAITLTRALGQSALSVISLAMVGQWFVRQIDKAMAIYSIVMSIGFMMAFPAVGSLVQSRGWRVAWFAVGAAILAGLVPLALLIVRRNPESIGLRPDGEPGTQNQELEPRNPGTRNLEPPGYSLREALFTSAFWIFAIGAALYGLVASGIGLFNESILAERGFGPNIYYQTLAVTALTGLAGNFVGGWLAGFVPLNQAHGSFAPGADRRTARVAAREHAGAGHDLGNDDGDWRWDGHGDLLQCLAARVRPAPPWTHSRHGSSDHGVVLGDRAAAARGVC